MGCSTAIFIPVKLWPKISSYHTGKIKGFREGKRFCQMYNNTPVAGTVRKKKIILHENGHQGDFLDP